MTRELRDPEFWLPKMFLNDDVFKEAELSLSRSNSGFSSPGDSSVASSGSESDEDEFLAELTRRLTGSVQLSRDLRQPELNLGLLPSDKIDTLWKIPTSPQSTLQNENVCTIARVQQDPIPVHFCAAPQKPSLDSVPYTITHAYHSNQRILNQPHQQNGIRNERAPGLSHSAWPTLQQSQSHKQALPVSWSGRAALLGSHVSNGGCSGTGVFLPLPRPVVSTLTQTPRKKQPVASKQRNVLAQSQQSREMPRAPATMSDNEIRLPQEWTY